MNFNIKYILLVSFSLFTLSLNAQQELGLNFSRQIWQANYTNPAYVVEGSKGHLALPSFYFGEYNNIKKFNLNNNQFSTATLYGSAASFNVLSLGLNSDLVDFGFRVKRAYFSYKFSVKSDYYIGLPKDLFGLAAFGNARYIGKEVQIGPDLDFSAYAESSIGTAYDINDDLTVGAKINIYNGIYNVSTTRNTASIYTDPDIYQLALKTDYQVNASGFDLDKLGDDISDVVTGDGDITDILPSGRLSRGNRGLGIDLGASYRVNDKIRVGASIVNLGSITWKKSVSSYINNGNYEFNGVDVKQIFQGDSISFANIQDSLTGSFLFKANNISSYKTTLPSRMYFSGTYQLNPKVQLSALLNIMNYHGNFMPAAAIGANYNIKQIWSIGATYAVRKNDFTNLGLNTMLRLGPLQAYLNLDNVLGTFVPSQIGNSNVRLGVNFIFGKTPSKPKVEVSNDKKV
jgi:hypothetical protein